LNDPRRVQLKRTQTLDFIDKQIDLESRIVQLVEENTSDLGNFFVRDLLLGIAQDSRKHAALLAALKALIEGRTPLVSEMQRDRIAKGIEQHIRMEAQAIEMYSHLMENSTNPKVKTVARMIKDDEVRHHKLLVDLRRALIDPETVDDETAWEIWWRGGND
jgi:rubrerythrin